MANNPIPLKGGLEQDALSGWKRYIGWKPGERKKAKKSYAKRVRQYFKSEAKEDE